jgi:hypothetical protein
MLTARDDASQPAAQPWSPTAWLRMVAEQLLVHGLKVREHVRGGELTEIEATNKRDPEQSRVIIGYDGFLTWEHWCPFRTERDAHAAAWTIATLLDSGSHQRQPAKPTGDQPGHGSAR